LTWAVEREDQRNVKKLVLAPYHLFQFRGNNYVFDVESSAIVRLDDGAYDAMSLRLESASSETIASHLAAAYGQETAGTVLRELRWLEQKSRKTTPSTMA
jgi:hypothetical protein